MKEAAPFWLAYIVILGQVIFVTLGIYLATDGFGSCFWNKIGKGLGK